jgi:hypothetical protein
MSKVGMNGVYRIYRVYADKYPHVERRLMGRFAIIGGVISILEDHDDFLEGMIPPGPLTGRILSRMQQLEHSAYWQVVHEDDIKDGNHEDLVPEFQFE